jgi:anthranilate phosphoribosyltransferase
MRPVATSHRNLQSTIYNLQSGGVKPMWERLKGIFGGNSAEPQEETASALAAEYYAAAQDAASHNDAADAIRQLAFAAELDDSYRVRATSDPAFDQLRGDTRYQLVVTRPPRRA